MSGAPDRLKRLLVVSPSLSGGGAERFASTLLCHIDRDRFEPHLCLLRDEITYPLPEDVPVTVLYKRSPWDIPRTIFRLRRHMSSLAPDVVLGTMISTNWLIGSALAPKSDVRWVGRFGNSLDRYPNLREKAFAEIIGLFLGKMDGWVGNSIHLTNQIKEVFKVPTEKLFNVGNPIDVKELDRLAAVPSPDIPSIRGNPRIISVGRFHPQKRFDVLIDAFARVRAKEQSQLVICGEGPLLEAMRLRTIELGVSGDVLLVGFEQNPFRWLSRSDLFVLTSDYEGLPNALIEAQALGLPAVATRSPTGPDEIVEDGVTGLLVPVGDIDAVAAAILDLVSDGAKRDRMGAAARYRARALFDHRKIIAQWEDVLAPPDLEIRR
jgi:glycosyltransferase involved in cell wall biosynthesis